MLVVPYLALQACIAFVAFQTRVAYFCFCLVRIKMPLLTYLAARRQRLAERDCENLLEA